MATEIKSKMSIHKPASEVYEAFADPEKMANYWFSSGTARVEQGKTITWRYEEYNAEGDIQVLETEENRKIVFSWGGVGEETVVTILLEQRESGNTIVLVTESGFKEDDPHLISKLLGQQQGWIYMLTCLKAYLENGIKTLRASLVH
ncbi:SRPBCC family protein [Neobacillus sp. SCS-31]|uniref:SRPBCC family protein n=1 Tax=Neobacillus oceani TaxID=3115292 RepID=UPI003906D0A1